MKTKKRRVLTISYILICIVAILCAIPMINSSGSVILIKTSEAAISSITEFVRTNGKVSPVTEVKISPDVSGEVTRLFVNEGDFIEADSLLLTIRQDPYLLAIKRAEAVLGASEARYEQQVIQFRRCSLDYNRAINLLDSESITQSEVDKIACDLDVSQSMLKNLKYDIEVNHATLLETQDQLRRTSIRSPISGTITRINIEQGERVVGTSQMAGTEIMRIADLKNMEIRCNVNENDISKIKRGNICDIEIDGLSKCKLSGSVTHIATSSKEFVGMNGVTNFEVRIVIDKHNSELKPGMSASAMIKTKSKESVTTIPIGAALFDEGREFVWVVDSNNIATKRYITTGIQDLHRIEIINGLNAGENIAVGPYNTIANELKDGTKVICNNK